jgi:DMSO reductase anchor subunit
MCYHRLSENEAPACVQACPNKAIKIISVSAYAIQLQSEAPFLPGAPMPGYTKPATQYISERKLPEDLIAADLYRLKKQDPHLPLVFMLLLTQLSIGFYAGGMLIHLFIPQMFSPLTITVITLVGTLAGIALGTLHLGKPLKAWKAFLGFRTSWMSREILAFAGLIQISSLLVVLYLVPAWSIPDMIYTFLHVLLLILCVVAFFSSVKLYEDTKRKLWNLRYTGFKFATSVMILGSIAIWTCASLQIRGQDGARPFLLIFPLSALIVKILLEMRFLNRAGEKDFGPEKKSALTALRILKPVVFVRITTAAIVSLILLFGLVSQTGTGSTTIDTIIAPIALVMVFASEFCERYLYFTTVDAPKMPGEM